MIELIVEPGKTVSWEQFCADAPPFSVALDGYVSGPPHYASGGPHLNLNHHEGVDRLSTRSTSGQVFVYVKQGLFRRFQQDGLPVATAYINDADQDTALAVWLLKHHERFEGERSEPLINRLVFAEDMLDTTAGAYPFNPDSDVMRELAWIFEPYNEAFKRIRGFDAGQLRNIIETIGSRIDQYVLGQGQKMAPDTRFDMLHQGTGWVLVREVGPAARTKLFVQGAYAFATVREERPDGTYHYSLGKMSPFVDFPIEELYAELNRREGISDDCTDRWGGSNTIGGSPRKRGSRMNPGQLAAVIEEFLKR